MSASFDFKAPNFFTAGTVGPPGQRVFYLQAREAGAIVTLKLEKEQVAALAEYLARLLTKLPAAKAPAAVRNATGDLALLEPIAAAWEVGSIGVAYDEALDRIVLTAEELMAEEAEGEPATARFRVSRAQAAMFVERSRELIKAGRKPCPICGRPMNPGGHICPRSNGHGRD